MADGHISDNDRQIQYLANQIDATQMVLNIVEHLPMLTEQIISDFRSGCETEQLERQLVCLHYQLLKLSKKSIEANIVRVSSVLCNDNQNKLNEGH